MVKAIIFDCFGVLATDGWSPFKDEHFGNSNALLAKAENLSHQMNTGIISYSAFVSEVATMAGVTPGELDKRIDSNVPNKELFNLIKDQLKAKYKIGALSNAGANWLDIIFSPDQMSLFDAVALSYEIGAAKPDKKAYQVIADRLNVKVEDCLFVDDQEKYCVGARQADMQAICYVDFKQFKSELLAYLAQSKE